MAKKEVRIFLDSNVILSGLISETGSPRIILDIITLNLPVLHALTGRYNIIEIERNLKKKMPAAIPVYREYLPKLNLEIIPMPSAKMIKNLSGHTSDKDVPVLASALAGKADFLVTGDKKDFARLRMKSSYPFKIVNPSEFLEVILPEIFKTIEAD
ncbi:MAG: putative toxin-antitoxin system toxin component, PIN family [Nitrospiraceae bacterium]|nr:putative toxin-antitoxin system toxin component, PIN family [Nitrospiraceae bacterium]